MADITISKMLNSLKGTGFDYYCNEKYILQKWWKRESFLQRQDDVLNFIQISYTLEIWVNKCKMGTTNMRREKGGAKKRQLLMNKRPIPQVETPLSLRQVFLHTHARRGHENSSRWAINLIPREPDEIVCSSISELWYICRKNERIKWRYKAAADSKPSFSCLCIASLFFPEAAVMDVNSNMSSPSLKGFQSELES